jgi:hypothetical protein
MKLERWSHEVWCCTVLNKFTSSKCEMWPLVHNFGDSNGTDLNDTWHKNTYTVRWVSGMLRQLSQQCVLQDGPSLLWVPAVLYFIRSCLRGNFWSPSGNITFRCWIQILLGKQTVVEVPEGGPRYDTTVGLIVNIFMTNYSVLIYYFHCVWYKLHFILLNLSTLCIISQLFHLPEFLLTDFHAECW